MGYQYSTISPKYPSLPKTKSLGTGGFGYEEEVIETYQFIEERPHKPSSEVKLTSWDACTPREKMMMVLMDVADNSDCSDSDISYDEYGTR